MSGKRALITGISGQDGSYLCEFLLKRGYEVHGIIRPEIRAQPKLIPYYIQPLLEKITLYGCDLSIPADVATIFNLVKPDECYHLGGPSTVDSNITGSSVVFQTILESTRSLLDAIKAHQDTRLFFAGTSEIFGLASQSPQTETSEARPRSIYGMAKLAAWDLIERERRKHGIFASVGLLYNHESIRRPVTFLPRKVSHAVARIATGKQDKLIVGNLEARRDWGYAPDFIEAIWLTLQTENPADYIIATGKTHTVGDLIRIAFDEMQLEMNRHIEVSEELYRPKEVVTLCGDASKLHALTGWTAQKPFEDMIRDMVRHDYALELNSTP